MHRTLDARHDRFALNAPFRISRGVKTVAEVVTVELRRGDAVGRGEAVPYARYGETPQSVLAEIIAATPALSMPLSRAELASLLPHGAARNAVDCALWDLEAKRAGRRRGALPERARARWRRAPRRSRSPRRRKILSRSHHGFA